MKINFVLRQTFKEGATEKVREERKKKNGRVDKYFNPDETAVLIYLGFDRKHRFKCNTGLSIRPKNWDFKKQQKRVMLSGSYEFNARLEQLRDNVLNYYNDLKLKEPNITFNHVKEKVSAFLKKAKNPDFEEGTGFFDVFDLFVNSCRTKVASGTIKKYSTLKTSLQNFIGAKQKYRNLTFSQLDLNFYDDYRSYLLTEVWNPKRKEMGLLNDTVAKYFGTLKVFLKWALERNYHQTREFQRKDFSSSQNPKHDIVTLKFDELRKFYNHDFSEDKRLEQVRDLFCFAAFSGQRWGDIVKFSKDDIKNDSWGFKADKTGKKTHIPFVGYMAPALDILEKYNFNLPKISNQKFNDYIKEAAQVVELDRVVTIERMKGREKIIIEQPLHQFITMHTGRRTCVSLLLNVAKMPIPQVMEITQHSDYKTLRKYINEDPEALRRNLESTASVISFEMKLIKKAN